ncbi:unnamed protein product, partial [Brachionus calyciflorus]
MCQKSNFMLKKASVVYTSHIV